MAESPKPPAGKARTGRGAPDAERFTQEKKRQFLALYAGTGHSVRSCAEQVGVTGVTVFNHINDDPVFAKAYARAVERHTDKLEDHLVDHAWDKETPGNIVALFGMLRARRPERWRENFKVEHGGQLVLTTAEALQQARERAKQSAGEPAQLN